MKAGLICATWMGIFASSALAQDVTVKPAGMQLIWDAAKKDFGGFSTYNQSEGASVSLIVTSTKGQIIDIPDNQGQVTIGGQKAKAFFTVGEARMNKERTKARIELTTTGAPKLDEKGALPVEGKLVLATASQTAEIKSEPGKLSENAVIKFPEGTKLPEIKIESVGKPKYTSAAWEIVLATNSDLDGVADFRFIDKTGKVITANRAGWTRSSMFGKVQCTLRLELSDVVEEGALVVNVWTDRAIVEVPVSLKLGAGGPQ